MMVCAESYKAPTVKIEPNNLQLHFFADTVFKVKDTNNKIVDVFTIKFVSSTSKSKLIIHYFSLFLNGMPIR